MLLGVGLSERQKRELGFIPGLTPLVPELDELFRTAGYDPGRRAVNVLRVASNVADTETVAIGRDVYEFDRAANGVTAGRIAVTGHADDTPAAATDALIAKINAKQGLERVTAVDISANEILIVADDVGAVVLACAETLAGANNAFAAAAMFGGRVAATRKTSLQTRVPTAVEVALGNLHFQFDFAPTVLGVFVYVTATPGVAKAWNGAVTVTGNRVTLGNGGDTDWAATDTVLVLVSD